MTREITHMKAFSAALESLGKPAFSIGAIPPTPGLVNQYFNDSTGIGDMGEPDTRGPWNEGNGWEFVQAPAFAEFESQRAGTRMSQDGSSSEESGSGSQPARKPVRRPAKTSKATKRAS